MRIGAVCQVGLAEGNAFGSWCCREWFGLCVFNVFHSEQSPGTAGGISVTASTDGTTVT